MHKFPRKIGFDSYFKKNNNHNIKNEPKNFHTISMPVIPKQNYKKRKSKFQEKNRELMQSKVNLK